VSSLTNGKTPLATAIEVPQGGCEERAEGQACKYGDHQLLTVFTSRATALGPVGGNTGWLLDFLGLPNMQLEVDADLTRTWRYEATNTGRAAL